jgi:outer membrane protein assembly factor BamA
VYTLKNQILILLPFEFYKNNEDIRFEGELGYYKYFYNYYGLGSRAQQEDLEFYDVIFPRFRGTLSKRIGDSPIYAGLLYQFDDMRFTKIESGGLLDVARPIGWDGGVISNVGFEVQYDNRDNIFTTRKGSLIKLTYHKSAAFLGSNFDYTNLSLLATHFIPIKDDCAIGFHLFTGSKYGGTPFFDMYYIGTPKIGRGIDDRRFQDKNSHAFQTEFRFPIYKKFSGVTFASINTVSNTYFNLGESQLIPTIGTGIRYTINKREKNQVRVDFGLYKEGWNIYATAANAF